MYTSCMVCYDRTIFIWDTTIWKPGNSQNIFMEHDLNILMIFGIKEKWIILTHTMYCCLLLQIYLCYLWLLFVLQGHILLLLYNIINILLFFINSLKMVHPQISILCWYFFNILCFLIELKLEFKLIWLNMGRSQICLVNLLPVFFFI